MKKFRLYYEEYNRGPFQLLWSHFARQHTALFGLAGVVGLLLLAIVTLILIPHDPYFQDPDYLLLPPSWQAEGLVKYPLGTDDLGRDLISRLMRGSSYTFGLAILAVIGALAGGLVLGALAG